MITPPQQNEDVRTLWRKVAECADALNALQNMKVVVEGKVKMLGQLEVGEGGCTMRIRDAKEVVS
jgi:hypothetical protein